MAEKYGLMCGDFHCGHLVGLTPPQWQRKYIESVTTKHNKFHKIASDLWGHFEKILEKLPPLDFVVCNGDMIDGKGKKSGGTEQITTSMIEQCDMASSVINKIRLYCKKKHKLILTYGTNYHVGSDGEDFETIVQNKTQADKVGAHEWLDVNGLVFDIKHHIGSSSIPHGRFTALARAGLWNQLWADEEMQPNSDVLIRSHVHYYGGTFTSNKLCMTLPALQGMGSKYGARICEGLVDWGMVLFRVKNKTDYSWTPFIHRIESQKAKAVKI